MPHYAGMHPYGTDSGERRLIPFLIAGAAIATALALYRVLGAFGLAIPWWVDAPSVMGLYGGIHALFDRYIWRRNLVRSVGLVAVPDLNGSWKSHIRSTHEDRELDASVEINQSWRGLHVRFETEQSRSTSLVASLITSDPNEFVLTYEFFNSPKQGAVASMQMHRGSAEIRFPRGEAITSGAGEYYSGRGRTNQGTLILERF